MISLTLKNSGSALTSLKVRCSAKDGNVNRVGYIRFDRRSHLVVARKENAQDATRPPKDAKNPKGDSISGVSWPHSVLNTNVCCISFTDQVLPRCSVKVLTTGIKSLSFTIGGQRLRLTDALNNTNVVKTGC